MENMQVDALIRLACLKYLGDPSELQTASVGELIKRALEAYLNA